MKTARALTFHLSHWLLTLLCLGAVVVLALVAAAGPLGYKILVDHSDSMRPAIAAGDVVVTHVQPVRETQVGDVVSFRDPHRTGRLITHRVVTRQERGGRVGFVTRGDANTGVERWWVARDGRIGRMVGRVPRAGRGLVLMHGGPTQIILLALSALMLVVLFARRIWAL
jgi:signal peptidase